MGVLFAAYTRIYDADVSQTALFQEVHKPSQRPVWSLEPRKNFWLEFSVEGSPKL